MDHESFSPAPELRGIDCLSIVSFIVGFPGVSLSKPDSRSSEVRDTRSSSDRVDSASAATCTGGATCFVEVADACGDALEDASAKRPLRLHCYGFWYLRLGFGFQAQPFLV